MARRVGWVMEAGAAGDEVCALGNGFADENFEIGKVGGGYAGANVDWLFFCCCCYCSVKVIADPQGFDTRGQFLD